MQDISIAHVLPLTPYWSALTRGRIGLFYNEEAVKKVCKTNPKTRKSVF